MAYPIIEIYAMFDKILHFFFRFFSELFNSIVYYNYLHVYLSAEYNATLSFVFDRKFVKKFIRKTFLKKTIWLSCLVRINLLCLPTIIYLHRVILVIYSHWLQTCQSIKNILNCFDLH